MKPAVLVIDDEPQIRRVVRNALAPDAKYFCPKFRCHTSAHAYEARIAIRAD
jgi:DNA-binding NtrC family response regulator